MFEELIFERVWIILPLWLILYFSDYYLTLIGARLYRRNEQKYFVYEGSYELTPQFQADVDNLRLVSPKFLRAVALSSILFVFVWYFSCKWEITSYYHLLCGGLILQEIAIMPRHFRNIFMFRWANKNQSVEGQICLKKWLTYRLSGVELISFSIIFLIVYLFTGSDSFLGGSILIGLSGYKHFELSKKAMETSIDSERLHKKVI